LLNSEFYKNLSPIRQAKELKKLKKQINFNDLVEKSQVNVISFQGNDDFICEIARVTTSSEKKNTKSLIRYLMRNQHHSPFEFCNITFEIEFPIFVARQFFRHRMFKYAEKSMRYYKGDGSDLKFYDFENEEILITKHNAKSLKNYQKLINKGYKSEQARAILSQSMMTKICVQCDLRNLMNFLRLRLDDKAQYEIRIIAEQMFNAMEKYFPITTEAFNDYILKSITLSKNEIDFLQYYSEKISFNLENLISFGFIGTELEDFENKLEKLTTYVKN